MNDPRRSLLRTVGLVLLVVAVAIAGLYAGGVMRRSTAPATRGAEAPQHGLPVGQRFPTVALLDEQAAPLVTDDLWRKHGAVILLLDLDCTPCGTMTTQWRAYVESDSLPGLHVVGIARATPEGARAYRVQHEVAFPIYADTGGVFLRDLRVMNYPLCAVVGRSGVLDRTTFDPYEEFRASDLIAALAR